MITYTGIHIGKDFGAPSIRDMSVAGMRLCRFAGAFEKYFWPIGMHSLLVSNLVPKDIEHHALLHDIGSEVVMGDIPKPHKTTGQKFHEKWLLERTYISLGLKPPTEEEKDLIHEADMKAVNAEGSLGCGPRGYSDTQTNYELDKEAVYWLKLFLDRYDVLDYINPDGKWVSVLEGRLRNAIRSAQSDLVYHLPS